MLSMGVMFAGLASYFAHRPSRRLAAQTNGEVGNVGLPLFLCAFIAVPLGMPLIFVGAVVALGGLHRSRCRIRDVAVPGSPGRSSAAVWS